MENLTLAQLGRVLEDIHFVNADGWNVHRKTIQINGHIVQVLQYDASPLLAICINQDVQLIHIDQAADHIRSMTAA